ncbi:MAG: ferrous iron transport protein A [Methanosarcinales archaeon]|nr:MAG: ferrous iron transport protein A [Methanosarcinales archaeon]
MFFVLPILSEVEPEETVTVKKTDGGVEAKSHLNELGIVKGTVLTVIATEPVHVRAGPISLKTAEKELVIARGWANKIMVEREGEVLPLLRLEAGENGTVKNMGGSKSFEGYFTGLGIEMGSEIEFVKHLPDTTLMFKVDDLKITMGEGQASKMLVEREGQTIQLNYLREGENAKMGKIVGGVSLLEKFKQMGLAEGKDITLVRKNVQPPHVPKMGTYVSAKIGDQLVTIGQGLSGRVWVE